MRRLAWMLLVLAAACTDGKTPDCSDPNVQCGPGLTDAAVEADADAAADAEADAEADAPVDADAADAPTDAPDAG